MAEPVTPDNWTPAVWSQSAVMDMQARLDPVRMTRYADDWHIAVDAIRDVLTDLDRQVAAHLESSWRGAGASAALDALRRYVTASLAGLAACRSVALHLCELARAAGDLRACVSDDLDTALDQVRQLYSIPAVAAGNAVDDIPPPPDPFETAGRPRDGALFPAPARAPAVGPPTAAGPFGLPSGPINPAPALAPNHHPAAQAPWAASRPDQQWHAPTHTAAITPRLDQPLPVPPEPIHTTPVPAAAPTAPSPPPGVSTRGPSSPAAMPFLGGMYPGHFARGDGGEHRAPRYLISAGNAGELIGELPLVAPPVIGE